MDAFIDFSSGTLGGIANVYAGQPLDTVKVKMQTFPHLYKNAFTCVYQTFKTDGIYRGLYAGTVPALVANVSTNAALFFAYGQCQNMVANFVKKSNIKDLSVVENGIAGSGAAIVAALVLNPADLVKCRLQAAREMNIKLRPFTLTKQIFKESGIRGFYVGVNSLLVREIPGYFVFFGAYELTRTFFTPENKTKNDIGVVKTIISGGMGGIASWCLVFPADVVKSRKQVDSAFAKKSFISCIVEIVKNEGIGKLYKGLGPTVVRTFFSTGALFGTVEESKKIMNKYLK